MEWRLPSLVCLFVISSLLFSFLSVLGFLDHLVRVFREFQLPNKIHLIHHLIWLCYAYLIAYTLITFTKPYETTVNRIPFLFFVYISHTDNQYQFLNHR